MTVQMKTFLWYQKFSVQCNCFTGKCLAKFIRFLTLSHFHSTMMKILKEPTSFLNGFN